MRKETLTYLLNKYLSGEPLTAAEEQGLKEWNASFESEPGLTDLYAENEQEQAKERMWNAIERKTKTTGTIIPMQRHRLTGRAAGIAAAVILLIALGMWWKLQQKPKEQPAVVETPKQLQPADIMPGGNKATLILGDGTVIALDSAGNGLLAQQGATTITKTNEGEVTYHAKGRQDQEIRYNLISTPVGGQYTVVLPDGSKVTLNAASSLRFPAQFAGEERRVTLTGEGYFDIVHNTRQPFIVNVNDVEVRDLGTAFNINAYTNEPVLKTTLVNGLAAVKSGGTMKKITPGQAAIVKDGQINIAQVDVSEATAWRNGIFLFDRADVDDIMRQVARWYDVEVVYAGRIRKRDITGKAYRNSTLKEMLKILKLSDIDFKIEGRKLIISD